VTDPRPDPATHVPAGPVPSVAEGRWLLDLIKVMARLRAPGGCPWDREQSHRTLARHLLEETHELLDAIDRDDAEAIRDELGDVLLQVVFHAQIAADEGRWDVDDVARGLVEKLVHRHPHVFGDVEVSGADEVLTNWEKLKAEEAGSRGGVADGLGGDPGARHGGRVPGGGEIHGRRGAPRRAALRRGGRRPEARGGRGERAPQGDP
jgi:NTP pyrophosphatase (non-canonical NTP hydrolase)